MRFIAIPVLILNPAVSDFPFPHLVLRALLLPLRRKAVSNYATTHPCARGCVAAIVTQSGYHPPQGIAAEGLRGVTPGRGGRFR